MNLEPAKALLQARLGLRFEGHGEAWLRSALERRMAAAGVAGVGTYVERLGADESELLALASLLTIKETYFYREPQHLHLLTEHLAPPLLRDTAPGAPVRILSVGCATGEEPYSIAMALRECWGESAPRRFRIEACDLDPQAIAAARGGWYRPYAFRALPPALTARWFSPGSQERRRIAAPLREAVAFRPLNLLADRYPEDLRGQDVIFYRNLSIYFDAPTRESVLRRLRGLLRPGGYLIVGLAETLSNGFGLLRLCEQDGVWYFAHPGADGATGCPRGPGVAAVTDPAPSASPAIVRSPGPPPSPPVRAAAAPAGGPPPEPAASPGGDALYRQALALARAERFAAALAVLAPVCAGPAALPAHHALQAHLLLERGDLAGAATAAQRVLAADVWSLDALVLLGRIARAQGDLGAAIDYLRRAIYQRSDHWQAHFELAECRRAAGSLDAARREYRIALHLLAQARGLADPVRPLPSALPVADLAHLCRARLARLADPA